MAFLYQRHNVDFLMAIFVADAPIAIKVSSLWSVLQIWITAVLVLPVAATSIGMMLGAKHMVRVFRVAVAASAVLSVGVLVIYAALAAPRVAGGGPVLLPNPRIHYELLVALGTLGLQIALLALCRRSGSNEMGGVLTSSAPSDKDQKPNKARQPSSRDPRLAKLPAPPFATRG
ncbi:MAG TPA: hypothetical protein VI485_27745 [Vicinamibacterales bacterium]|nr:hypothetical protein [Vicinamibacterales bacterium]